MDTSRKKILFTIPNFDTAGSGKALLKIATGLNKDEFEPHIACLNNKGAYFKTVEASGIPIHVLGFMHEMRPLLKSLGKCWRTSRYLRQQKFDIIHSYHYGADYSEAVAARMAGIKWVFTKKNMNWGGSSANSWKMRSALAHRIAVQNHDMEREFYPGSNKTFYLTRGVDLGEFFPTSPDKTLRAELGLDERAKIVISVANLVPVKGIDVLVNAFAKVNDVNAVLVLVGDDKNEYGDFLKQLAQQLNLDGRILFTGKRHDVARFLSVASLFVLPTFKEGSPVAMLEAMASGVPVIGTNVPGIKEQLQPFPELLVEANNADALAQQINAFFAKPDGEVRDLINRILEHTHAHYSLDREIADHERLYRLCLNR